MIRSTVYKEAVVIVRSHGCGPLNIMFPLQQVSWKEQHLSHINIDIETFQSKEFFTIIKHFENQSKLSVKSSKDLRANCN